ncbi:ankyrin [Xylariaceae sp. AK1471]|nr:ankyrin [Xylariaceae sp. AK1471]
MRKRDRILRWLPLRLQRRKKPKNPSLPTSMQHTSLVQSQATPPRAHQTFQQVEGPTGQANALTGATAVSLELMGSPRHAKHSSYSIAVETQFATPPQAYSASFLGRHQSLEPTEASRPCKTTERSASRVDAEPQHSSASKIQPTYNPKMGEELLRIARRGYTEQDLRNRLSKQADPNVTTSFGDTALHLAARNNSPQLIKPLIEGGARCDVQNAVGDTPLHVAARLGLVTISEDLILYGKADPELRNLAGKTPRDEVTGTLIGSTSVLLGWGERLDRNRNFGELFTQPRRGKETIHN